MARPLSTEARKKILNASAEVIADAGIDGFTLDEVVRRSGVAKTTIYRHFSSANELLVESVDGTIAPFPAPDTGSLRQDLIEFGEGVLPLIILPELRSMMLGILLRAVRDPELARIHITMMEARTAPLRTMFDRAIERGELPATLDFDTAWDFMEGPFAVRWLLRPEALPDIDIPTTTDRIIAALAVRSAP